MWIPTDFLLIVENISIKHVYTTGLGTPCHFACWHYKPEFPPSTVSLCWFKEDNSRGCQISEGSSFMTKAFFIRRCPLLLGKHSTADLLGTETMISWYTSHSIDSTIQSRKPLRCHTSKSWALLELKQLQRSCDRLHTRLCCYGSESLLRINVCNTEFHGD